MRLIILLLISQLALAEPSVDAEQNMALRSGITSAIKGDLNEAWKILIPLAKDGNTEAMFHLGSMLIRTNPSKHNIELARRFLSEASRRNHTGAKALLNDIDKSQRDESKDLTIAGRSGLPSPEDLSDARTRMAEFEAETGTKLSTTDYMSNVLIFVEDDRTQGILSSRLYETIKSKFGDSVKVTNLVITSGHDWKENISQGSEAFSGGDYSPDVDGVIAKGYGISRFPSVVVINASGKPTVFEATNAQDILQGIKHEKI